MRELSARKYNIVLDTKRGSRVPLIDITSGDSDSVFFHITISESGEVLKVPDKADVMIYFAKADNTRVVQSTLDGSVAVLDGKILCNVMSNSIGLSSNTRVEVKIRYNDMLITPRHFEFKVSDTELCDGDIVSTNEFPILIELINRVEDLEIVENATFGKSELIVIEHTLDDYIVPTVNVYKSGFGDGGFGNNTFGGDSLIQEDCKVTHLSKDKLTIQPNDNYKECIVSEIEEVSDVEYIVKYEDSEGYLYVRLG